MMKRIFLIFHSMDKILERYERYSYAEKVLISAESDTQVKIKSSNSVVSHISISCLFFELFTTPVSVDSFKTGTSNILALLKLDKSIRHHFLWQFSIVM